MKKVLCGIVCVAAGAALAVEPVTVATVEVRAVNSGLTNTIVAIPGLDLATGGALAISNLVKTTNLAAGDMLYAFSNGEYETWELVNTAGVKHWEKATIKCTIRADGQDTEAGASSASYTMSVGSGIWLSRKMSGSTGAFYVYAQKPASIDDSTVAAGATELLGNPTGDDATPTIDGAQNGDQIIVPSSTGFLKVVNFTYEVKDDVGAWVDDDFKSGLPSNLIKAGTGFWYKAASDGSTRTISWQ